MPSFPTPKIRPSGRLYIASPLPTYRTQRYERRLAAIVGQFPGVEILQPRLLFTNNAHWCTARPSLIKTLHGVVVFPDTDGTIGLGTFTEVSDAQTRGIRVWYLNNRHRFREAFDLAIIDDGQSWRKYARILSVRDAKR